MADRIDKSVEKGVEFKLWRIEMKPRSHSRVSPYKKVRIQVSTDMVCFNGIMRDVCCEGACIGLQTTESFPVYIDNRLLIRCKLNDLHEDWFDEILIGKVRWIKKEKDETVFGVEFLDTDEYYHPRISSLRSETAAAN